MTIPNSHSTLEEVTASEGIAPNPVGPRRPTSHQVALVVMGFPGLLLFGIACLFITLKPAIIVSAARVHVTERSEKALADRGYPNVETLQQRAVDTQAKFENSVREKASDVDARSTEIVSLALQRLSPQRKVDKVDEEKLGELLTQHFGSAGVEATIERSRNEIEKAGVRAKQYYEDTLRNLLLELRIFTFTNAMLFAAVLLCAASPRVAKQLFPAASILFTCTLLCASLYVFDTNWLFRILFGSYMGWSYVVVVLLVFLRAFWQTRADRARPEFR